MTLAPDWLDAALCIQVDTGDAFFVDQGESARDAKAICALCPVRAPCLQAALTTGEAFGIRGGTTAMERRHMTPADPGATTPVVRPRSYGLPYVGGVTGSVEHLAVPLRVDRKKAA